MIGVSSYRINTGDTEGWFIRGTPVEYLPGIRFRIREWEVIEGIGWWFDAGG